MSKVESEIKFWGDCTNTYLEEEKHYVYGKLMGLTLQDGKFILPNIRVLDVGGGPVSLLLKCEGLLKGRVLDPIDYPDWTKDRYKAKRIDVTLGKGEDQVIPGYDEVWIYNMIGLVDDKETLVKNAFESAPIVRVFEWIDLQGDRNREKLSEEYLNDLFSQKTDNYGKVVELKLKGCFGKAFYGVFERNES